MQSGADALILVPPFAERLSDEWLAALGVPVAVIAAGKPRLGIITSRIDNYAAMRAMTDHVIGQGHVRLAHVSGPRVHEDSEDRRRGFLDAVAAHGVEGEVVEGDFGFESGGLAAEPLLDRTSPPTAILCGNDDMAAGVIQEAGRRGLLLPGALAVTGFDDTLLAARLWPPLTTIHQPIETMAFKATQKLVARLNATDLPFLYDEVEPFEIVERQSTAIGEPCR